MSDMFESATVPPYGIKVTLTAVGDGVQHQELQLKQTFKTQAEQIVCQQGLVDAVNEFMKLIGNAKLEAVSAAAEAAVEKSAGKSELSPGTMR